MASIRVKPLRDQYGVIRDASKILPQEFHSKFIDALAELEDNECHIQRSFPVTRLHKVRGTKHSIYRADIDKITGWRLHVQYCDPELCLIDILEGQKHDHALKAIKAKRQRYS